MSIDLDVDLLKEESPTVGARRGDGMIRVQVVPLIRDSAARSDLSCPPSGSLISEQLIVDYLAALAQHTVKAVRSGEIERIQDEHIHPENAPCLRCAVIGSTHLRTLASALLEILDRANTTNEEWNNNGVTDVQMISRLRRLAVSSANLEEIYGENWAQVIVTCLRVEAASLEMVDYLTRNLTEQLSTSDLDTFQMRHAAYHLGTTVCPRELMDEESSIKLRRGGIAKRFGVALSEVAVGNTAPWLDHLPVPPL